MSILQNLIFVSSFVIHSPAPTNFILPHTHILFQFVFVFISFYISRFESLLFLRYEILSRNIPIVDFNFRNICIKESLLFFASISFRFECIYSFIWIDTTIQVERSTFFKIVNTSSVFCFRFYFIFLLTVSILFEPFISLCKKKWSDKWAFCVIHLTFSFCISIFDILFRYMCFRFVYSFTSHPILYFDFYTSKIVFCLIYFIAKFISVYFFLFRFKIFNFFISVIHSSRNY